MYQENADDDLSWTQRGPATSFRLIRELVGRHGRVLDVGGGSSALAARLAAAGYRNVTVLDVSKTALERGRGLEVEGAPPVDRRRSDILGPDTAGPVELWHDRAVFHFLTRAADRRRYVRVAANAVRTGGHLVVAAFAPDGPPRCSGLPVRRYGGPGLAREFAPWFRREKTLREDHVTPWGAHQPFTYDVLVRSRRPPPDLR